MSNSNKHNRNNRRKKEPSEPVEHTWEPRTRLGHMVLNGDITSMEGALNSGLPLKEYEIVDHLLPNIEDRVIDINMVQRMTDSGRRVKFRCCVAIGDKTEFVGYAETRETQVGAGIQKAVAAAKLNLIQVHHGAGSWEDRSNEPHSLSIKTKGKSGSVVVELFPAPLGLGLAAAPTVKTILELAGIRDAWTKCYGNTRTTMNLAKATFNALDNASRYRSSNTQRNISSKKETN